MLPFALDRSSFVDCVHTWVLGIGLTWYSGERERLFRWEAERRSG
jgi:hypothetical protein